MIVVQPCQKLCQNPPILANTGGRDFAEDQRVPTLADAKTRSQSRCATGLRHAPRLSYPIAAQRFSRYLRRCRVIRNWPLGYA
jgi:hypothetical protein